MVVAHLVEQTPDPAVLVRENGRFVHEDRCDVQVRHDRAAGVHVAGADLRVGHVALGPFALERKSGQLVACIEHTVPERHELVGIVERADVF